MSFAFLTRHGGLGCTTWLVPTMSCEWKWLLRAVEGLRFYPTWSWQINPLQSWMLVEETRLQGQRWRMVYYSNSSSQSIISFAPFSWAPVPTGWCEEGRRTPAHTVGCVMVEEPEFSSENPELLYGQWACLPFVLREALSLCIVNSFEKIVQSKGESEPCSQEVDEKHERPVENCLLTVMSSLLVRDSQEQVWALQFPTMSTWETTCLVFESLAAWVPGEGWSLGLVPPTFCGLRFHCYFWSLTWLILTPSLGT